MKSMLETFSQKLTQETSDDNIEGIYKQEVLKIHSDQI